MPCRCSVCPTSDQKSQLSFERWTPAPGRVSVRRLLAKGLEAMRRDQRHVGPTGTHHEEARLRRSSDRDAEISGR